MGVWFWYNNVFNSWYFAQISSHSKRGIKSYNMSNFFFQNDFLPHSSSKCLLEGNKEIFYSFLFEPPKPLLLEGIMDNMSWFSNGMPYLYLQPNVYIFSIHREIEQSCSKTYQSWCDFCLLSHFHDFTSNFSLAMIEIPTCYSIHYWCIIVLVHSQLRGRSYVV